MKIIATFIYAVVLLSCVHLRTNGELNETHDFAEPENPFEKEPTSMFEYDRNGTITINGHVNGFFRLPGLPHENNNIGNSDVTWKFCLKTNSSCKNGIKVCINYHPGYPQSCDYEVAFYSDTPTVYHLDWTDTKSGRRESWIFIETYANCVEHTHHIPHQAYLAGGSVPNTESTCDATLQIYGAKVPKCTWRWHANEINCDNGRFAHNMTVGFIQYGTSGYVHGTHIWSTNVNAEFTPRFAEWTLGQYFNSDHLPYWTSTTLHGLNDSTTANGWSRLTAMTWNDIIMNYQDYNYILTINGLCDANVRSANLQKIWYCGTYPTGIYEVKSGLFRRSCPRNMSDTHAEQTILHNIVLIKDFNHLPVNSSITSTSAFNASPKVSAILTVIPAFLLFLY
ncbi:hypothetical protein Ddc_13278 [Ditylenchus destructor]|nr:hypothetical protein Ddc_13278 [Ditylenchus destructor]